VKALIVFSENLLKEAGLTEDDLAKIELLISTHILANPTAAASDIVLPGSTAFEKRGSMVNVTGRLQRLNAAAIAPGDARDDWEIIRDLTDAISGNKTSIYMIEDVLKAIGESNEAFAGITYSKIGEKGLPVIETGVTIPLIEKEKQRVQNREIVG